MKQYLKRMVLAMCLVACFFVLSACSSASTNADESSLDPQMASYITQTSEQLVQTITSLDKESGAQSQEYLIKQKEEGLAGGVASWLNSMNDTGSLVEILDSDAQESSDGSYIGIVNASFEKRNAQFKFFYAEDGQQMEVTSISISPEYTTGEKMQKAAMNTLMGMGTVFIVLIFISLLIGCFKYINVVQNNMGKKKDAQAEVAPAPVAKAPVQVADTADEDEIAVVIAAAIAAAEEDELAETVVSNDKLVARSIRHANRSRRRW